MTEDNRKDQNREDSKVSGNVVDDAKRRRLMAKFASGAFVAPAILLTLGAPPAAAAS